MPPRRVHGSFGDLLGAGSRLLKSRQKVLWHIQHSVAFVPEKLLTIAIDRLIEWVYRYRARVLNVFLSTRLKSYRGSNSRLFKNIG